jgi:AcrR family transcriptional regulator
VRMADEAPPTSMVGDQVAPGGGPAGDDRRPGGRPRSAAADEAILAATLELLVTSGYDGLTVESVAERAGVAKTTVYRRYRDKESMVTAAAICCRREERWVVDTGSVEGDLLAVAEHMREVFTDRDSGRIIPAVVAAAARAPELAREHRRFIAGRRQVGSDAVRRGIERGELPAGTDPDLLIDLIGGPIFYRAFNSGGDLSDGFLRQLVRRALAAFA